MYEKVNPAHPDKVADRIAGAVVDLAYKKNHNARMACEVLIGHGRCMVVCETSEQITDTEVRGIVKRITGDKDIMLSLCVAPQAQPLASNQGHGLRCGDNGIFCGAPVTKEQQRLADIAARFYGSRGVDGKYIADGDKLIICQSGMNTKEIRPDFPDAVINPLGDWDGGTNVDTGATNRKLGSDMGDGVTGGGLHGKDLSKADVSVNIWAHLKAQETGRQVRLSCAIGDDTIDGVPYAYVVKTAAEYIKWLGGFEKFAEWGLIRPKGV